MCQLASQLFIEAVLKSRKSFTMLMSDENEHKIVIFYEKIDPSSVIAASSSRDLNK